jgi:hypothetical protein
LRCQKVKFEARNSKSETITKFKFSNFLNMFWPATRSSAEAPFGSERSTETCRRASLGSALGHELGPNGASGSKTCRVAHAEVLRVEDTRSPLRLARGLSLSKAPFGSEPQGRRQPSRFWSFDIRICLAFRYSNFGFRMLYFWPLCDRVNYARYYWSTPPGAFDPLFT